MDWLRPRYQGFLDRFLGAEAPDPRVGPGGFRRLHGRRARAGDGIPAGAGRRGSILVEQVRMPSVTLAESMEKRQLVRGENSCAASKRSRRWCRRPDAPISANGLDGGPSDGCMGDAEAHGGVAGRNHVRTGSSRRSVLSSPRSPGSATTSRSPSQCAWTNSPAV